MYIFVYVYVLICIFFKKVSFKTRETLIEAANLYTIKIGLVCCLDVINVRNGTIACSPKMELS